MSFEQFLTDERTQFACAMAIAQAGEKAKQLSQQLRQKTSPADWKSLIGIRDWIVHGYDDIEYDILYNAITQDCSRVMSLIARLLESYPVDDTVTPLDNVQWYKDAK